MLTDIYISFLGFVEGEEVNIYKQRRRNIAFYYLLIHDFINFRDSI